MKSVEFAEKVSRSVGKFIDWHFRGIMRIHVNIDPNRAPENPEPCPCCGGKLVEVMRRYELINNGVPTPFPKSMFDAAGTLARKTLSLFKF